MINLKAVLAAGVVTSMVVGTSAYTSKGKKTTRPITYYFNNSSGLTRGDINPGTLALIQSEVKSAANWNSTSQAGGSGEFLNGIRFDQEPDDVSNGINDGQYSLQEAVNAVWAEYIRSSQFNLPDHNKSFTPLAYGASPITIERATCNSECK